MKNSVILHLFATVLFMFGVLVSAYSQQENKGERRPRIGVVLSGGGAKGIAHVGILKAMEEAGLRPDFIVGTSMGSIIGGLYATGYSADQLDSIIRQIDWNLVLSNNIPLNYISFEEKEYYNRYLVELAFDNGKLTLPSGMIEGQMLGQMLSHYTWPAMKYDSFDEFPIPFRCVATDVSTGKPIVFHKGSLSEALRASMAIPTVFTAADLDSTLAVDGGVLDNFPVDVALKMGADYIIGVNVSDEGLIPAKELKSMTGILMQVAMFSSLRKVKEDIALCDIYIKPDLKKYSTGSFNNYAQILELGYQAGDSAAAMFRELAKNFSEHYPPPSGVSLSVDPVYISKIELVGNNHVSRKLILGKLGLTGDQIATREEIEMGINRVFGINAFKRVSYQIEKVPHADKYILNVKMVEKQPASLKASVHYDNLFSAGIVLNFTMRDLLGKSSRFIVEGDISANPKARVSYLKYLGKKQRIAGIVKYRFLNEKIPEYDHGTPVDIGASTYNEFSGGLLLTQLLKHSVFAGITYNYGLEKLKFGELVPEGIKNLKINQFRADIFYDFNTLNDRNYPSKGTAIKAFTSLFMNNKYYINFDNPGDTVYIDDGMGNSYPFTETLLNELIIEPQTPNVYGKVQFDYSENVLAHHPYVPINNLDNFDFKNMIDSYSLLGYGIKVTYKSPLGPVSFGLGDNTNGGPLRWYIGIGYSFNYKD